MTQMGVSICQMPRASHIQKAERLNLARTLLQRYPHWPEVAPAIGPELLRLRAPGLSLPRAGTATQAPRPGRRCQGVLYRQAFAPSRTATPRLRRFDRIDLERDRQPCLPGGTAPRGRSWLTRRPVSYEPSIWNTASTDYCRTSWFRPTTCSCRTGTGRLLQARSLQAARRW